MISCAVSIGKELKLNTFTRHCIKMFFTNPELIRRFNNCNHKGANQAFTLNQQNRSIRLDMEKRDPALEYRRSHGFIVTMFEKR